MEVEFLTDFKAQTTTGSRTITAGTVFDLEEGKSLKLKAAGVVKAVDKLSLHMQAPSETPAMCR